MYYFYLDKTRLPIPPAKMETTIKNMNRTVNLVDKGEVNIIKNAGLTEISFAFMLPNEKYPFDQTLLIHRKADYYTKKIEKLKVSKKPFRFICIRLKGNTMLANTNMLVTLEEYHITESHEEGFDWIVTVRLKKYVDFGTKTIQVTENDDGTKTGKISSSRPSDKVPNEKTVVKEGQTLQEVVKKELGNTDDLFKIAALNKVTIPAVVAVGEVLSLKS